MPYGIATIFDIISGYKNKLWLMKFQQCSSISLKTIKIYPMKLVTLPLRQYRVQIETIWQEAYVKLHTCRKLNFKIVYMESLKVSTSSVVHIIVWYFNYSSTNSKVEI